MSLSPEDFKDVIGTISRRLRILEGMERAETAGAARTYTVAGLPAAGEFGRIAFATNGRKVGEGVGAGTGVFVYDDTVQWRRTSDDTTVVA